MKNMFRTWTQARVGLGRLGCSLSTQQHLDLLEAQALARDSLWRIWDPQPIGDWLNAQGFPSFYVQSEALNRQHFLMRPDLGRKITSASRLHLQKIAADPHRTFANELVFCVSDGLSTDAITGQLQPFLEIFLARLQKDPSFQHKRYPFILAPYSRVAAADDMGEALDARLSILFVGERPGLSAHDSLGVYLTYQPRPGLPDSRRNCLSNIRSPDGLSFEVAAEQLLYLIKQSLRLGLTGVELKLDPGQVLTD